MVDKQISIDNQEDFSEDSDDYNEAMNVLNENNNAVSIKEVIKMVFDEDTK